MNWAMKAITSFCGSHTVLSCLSLNLNTVTCISVTILQPPRTLWHGLREFYTDKHSMLICVRCTSVEEFITFPQQWSFCQPWQSCKSHRRRFIHSSRHKTTAACRPVQVLTVSPYSQLLIMLKMMPARSGGFLGPMAWCLSLSSSHDLQIHLRRAGQWRVSFRWTVYNNYTIIIITMLHLYSAFLGTQSALHRRGGLLNHHQCAASSWMIRRQPYCTRSPPPPTHTHTHQLISGEWWSQSVYGDD